MRVALVTGAGRGIGFDIAQMLVVKGFRVLGADVEIADVPGVEMHQLDVTAQAEMERFLEHNGGVDVLVNNAGVVLDAPFLTGDVGAGKDLFDVNFFAALFLSQLFIPAMMDRGWGRIINIGSVAARTGGTVSNSLYYAASKAALMSATRSLAREFGGDGITVNSVVPGAIATAMAHEGRTEAVKEQLLARLAINRFGRPSDVSNAVAFLCSDDSSFITGASVDVNGGWNMA